MKGISIISVVFVVLVSAVALNIESFNTQRTSTEAVGQMGQVFEPNDEPLSVDDASLKLNMRLEIRDIQLGV